MQFYSSVWLREYWNFWAERNNETQSVGREGGTPWWASYVKLMWMKKCRAQEHNTVELPAAVDLLDNVLIVIIITLYSDTDLRRPWSTATITLIHPPAPSMQHISVGKLSYLREVECIPLPALISEWPFQLQTHPLNWLRVMHLMEVITAESQQ